MRKEADADSRAGTLSRLARCEIVGKPDTPWPHLSGQSRVLPSHLHRAHCHGGRHKCVVCVWDDEYKVYMPTSAELIRWPSGMWQRLRPAIPESALQAY